MILIVSEESKSVCDVMDWLHYYKTPYVRINHKDMEPLLNSLSISKTGAVNISFIINDKKYFLSDFDAVWIRHGFVSFSNFTLPPNLQKTFPDVAKNLLNQEVTLKSYVAYELQKIYGLGKNNLQDVNKLHSLKIAALCGLVIPETIILSTKQELKELLKEKRIITKSIQSILHALIDKDINLNYTEEVTEGMLNGFPNVFTPSLFQPLVNKRFEIRTFYLNEKCYSMAIFSQNDKQTSVDFRKYNNEKPNRTIPFQLPEKIEKNIIAYMNKMGLKTGSIDLICTEEHEFIFLEVNPVGQFGMVSYPCNYNIEKKIAKYLIKHE